MTELPIHVSQEDLQENPGFASLLQELATNHISKDGISKGKATKLEHCTLSLRREKNQYLQLYLYYTTITDLLLDYKLNTATGSSPEDNRFYEMLSRALNTAEARMVLRENEQVGLRMDAQAVRDFQIGDDEAVKQQLKILGAKLLPKLEMLFEEKCATLAEFYDTTTTSISRIPSLKNSERDLLLAKGLKLGEVVANKKQQTILLEQTVKNDSLHNTRVFWEYYKVLEKQLTNEDELAAEWQKTRLATLKLKLEVVEQQLKQETYADRENVKPIEGLRTIAEHIKTTMEQARLAHEQAVMHKSQYESIGLGFSDLATEYGKLQRAIANKVWALQELNSQ